MKLTDYLEKRGLKVYTFAQKLNIHVRTAYKLLEIPAPVHCKTMLMIYEFTNGHVTPNDLLGVKPTKKALEF